MGRKLKGPSKIRQALLVSSEGMRWRDLLKETGLGKGTLSRNLNKMMESGEVIHVINRRSRPLVGRYVLRTRALVNTPPMFIILENFMHRACNLWYKPIWDASTDRTIDDDAFLEIFTKRIGIAAVFILLEAMKIKDVEDTDLWLTESFATPYQRREWIYLLLKRMRSKLDLDVKINLRNENEMVKMLPHFSDKQIDDMKASLKKLYPEVEFLNRGIEHSRLISETILAFKRGDLDSRIGELPVQEAVNMYRKYYDGGK